jgi:gamma-glutamyl hercynylcysteine S-oxide synthase
VLAIQQRSAEFWRDADRAVGSPCADRVYFPAGQVTLGSDDPEALDNERPAHGVNLKAYWLDRFPVTQAQYRDFIDANGYQQSKYWSAAGWDWVQTAGVTAPFYGGGPETEQHPVCGVSWYEASAYARFAGKRLPTEAEWEQAAHWRPDQRGESRYPWGDDWPTSRHCNHADGGPGRTTPVHQFPAGHSGCGDLLGNVWEWTNSTFEGYPGFKPYPYPGYSQAYYDGAHYVLRGGSWATRPWALRASFRNWYHPWTREIFAGFRCARDG